MKLRNLVLGAAMAGLTLACTSAREADSAASAGGSSAARGSVPLRSEQTRQQLFERLDANKSGTVSRAEAQQSPPLMVIFVEMDANSDGELSAVEWGEVPLVTPDGTRVP
jgi:hypothetical protein